MRRFLDQRTPVLPRSRGAHPRAAGPGEARLGKPANLAGGRETAPAAVRPALFLDGVGIKAPYQLRDLIAFTMLVMVLIFRPHGILGERLATKRA